MSLVDITILVPTRNEEKNLGKCLVPLEGWAKEILVIDSHSTDNTEDIGRSYGAKVLQFTYQGGWPKKRQYVLDTYQFTTDWILLLDCDEILTDQAKIEIEEAVKRPEIDGYYLFFSMEFLGKVLKRSDPGLRKLSLFRVGKGNYEERFLDQDTSMADMEIHEHVIVRGNTSNLVQPVIHRNNNDLSRFISKHIEYANYECMVHTTNLKTAIEPRLFGNAEERRRFLKKVFIRNPIAPLIYFLYLYIFKGGFMEGRPGFYYVLYQCIYLYFVNSKIYEIEKLERIHE